MTDTQEVKITENNQEENCNHNFKMEYVGTENQKNLGVGKIILYCSKCGKTKMKYLMSIGTE